MDKAHVVNQRKMCVHLLNPTRCASVSSARRASKIVEADLQPREKEKETLFAEAMNCCEVRSSSICPDPLRSGKLPFGCYFDKSPFLVHNDFCGTPKHRLA
jgi:hypothetical protein